jgi:hypothetical protein
VKCGIKCPHWYFRFNFPIGTGVICKKYKLQLLDARDKCFKTVRKRRHKKIEKPIKANRWYGSLRGWGSITMPIGREREL